MRQRSENSGTFLNEATRSLILFVAPQSGHQERGNLRLDRPRQQGPGAAAQHLGQRIGKRRWLGKLQNGIVTHGVSLLRWRSGGSITPTIRRLNPSPRHQLLAIAPRRCNPSTDSVH